MSDFGGCSHPVGRKEYRCEWCGQKIPKGEKHVAYVGMWENEFQNWRMHDECYADAQNSDEMSDGFSSYDHERPVKASVQAAEPIHTTPQTGHTDTSRI
jgi:hypothetical protein